MSFHCKLQETKDSDIFFTIVSQSLAWHASKYKINLSNLNDWINNNPYFRILTEDKELCCLSEWCQKPYQWLSLIDN